MSQPGAISPRFFFARVPPILCVSRQIERKIKHEDALIPSYAAVFTNLDVRLLFFPHKECEVVVLEWFARLLMGECRVASVPPTCAPNRSSC